MSRKFCGECGTAHTVLEGHQHCSACGHTDWANPIPVAVCLQPVRSDDGRLGLLIGKRAIEPSKGSWCLIGGHIEDGETIECGARRELREETGETRFSKPRLIQSYANGKGHVLITAQFSKIIAAKTVKEMVPCPENEAFDVLYEPRHLGFPIHTWAARQWFEDRSFLDPVEDETNEIVERVLRRGNLLDDPGIAETMKRANATGGAGLDELFRPYINDMIELAKRYGEAA